ncbi:uncharacterized protein LOC131740105 [Acipenser ruthenus]|uniref:uncharacterized protein LOC131740105 n=1 Tax=Acipenser ruthenus TaxID=7906 RepID=UPI00274262B5|nr:uncharacterized protein LOC131740105 [Acipenser ruthenus]
MCLTSTLSNAYVITRHTTAADSQGTLAGITVGSMLLFFVLCFLCLCLLLLIVSRKRKVVQPKENDLECGVADNCNQTQANPNQSNVSVFKKVQKTTEQLQTGSCEKMDAMIMNISTISETRKDECKHHINKEVSQNKLFMYPEENHHIQRFSLEPESDNKIILSQDLDEAGERESGAKTGRKSRRHPDEQTEQKESNKDSMAEHPPIIMNKLCFIQRLPTYYNDSCKDPTSAETPVYGTLASHSSMDDKHDLKLSAQVLQEHRDSDLTAANGKGKSCMLADKENLFDSITSFPNDKSGESDEARPGEPDQNEIRLSATTFKTEKLTSTEEKTGEGISDHSALSLQDCDGSPRPALSTSGVNLPDSKADTQHEELTHEKMPEAHAVRTESDSKGEPGACYQAGTEPGIAFNEPYNVDTNSAAADNMAMINRCGFRGQRQEKQSIRSMDSCENMINCFTSDAEVTDSHTYSVESLCFPETPQQCKEDIGPKHVMTTIQNKIRRKRALSEDPLSPINNKVGTQISYVASAMKHSFPGNENQTDKLNRSFFLKRRTSSLPPAQFSTGKARRKAVAFSSVSDLGRYKKDCSAPAPRDVDLLNDNQYLEMNLLYEVAENKGRRRRGKSCPGPSLPCEKVL